MSADGCGSKDGALAENGSYVCGRCKCGMGGGGTHLNCYACLLGLLTVNNRMQSVINLIYVPRHKKIQAVII